MLSFPELDESEEDSALSKVCSIFSQMLQLISRTGFDAAVRKHKTGGLFPFLFV
jgi:hypothetical protein